MKMFLTFSVALTTLALGGCLDVRPSQPLDPDAPASRDMIRAQTWADNTMKRSTRPKHEYRQEINKQFEEEMFNLRLQFEMRKITFEQLSRQGSEIEARKVERLDELDKNFGVSSPLPRALSCETKGRSTFCD